ncbi:MAG: hypothetical protein KC415_00445 [Anaerolineales bacterium]|nr:hypothetical protein [Anaerolineales bacterium]MCB9434490.1 hypothetical protein [Ardenticatenaceae bacterium]
MIERVTTYTPLGLCFWDAVTDSQISDGLRVTARLLNQPHRRVAAFRTGSGFYAFRDLPGLRALEYPQNDVVPLDSTPPRTYLVEVTDKQRRFLPVRFRVDLPITDYTGIYRPLYPASPPQKDEPRFYLFSAPARSRPAGTAAIYTQLVEANRSTPAAWAFIEMVIAGTPYYTYSDRRGCATLMLPWPPLLISPLPGTGLADQCWDVEIQVRYQSKTAVELSELWEFSRIRHQPAATLHQTTNSIAQPHLVFPLCYGQELIVQTAARTALWLEPG